MSNLQLGIFRRSRMRLIRQTELAECGLAAVAMVANFYGSNLDLASLRRRFQPSIRGATLKTLVALADRLGLVARPVKLPLEALGKLHLPAILHWDMNHYVVLEAVRGSKALVHNPDGRTGWIPFREMSDHFTGVALELRPSDDFEPEIDRQRLRLPQLWRKMIGLKRTLLQTLLLSCIMQAFALVSPYYMQIALDDALPALDRNLLTVLAAGFGAFTLINTAASLLRSFVLLSAGTTLGFSIAVNVARRLYRLPIAWFEKRHVGDILSRFQSITPVRQFLTEGAIGSALDGSLAMLTFAIMLFYSPMLSIVALTGLLAYAAVRWVSFAAQRRSQEDSIALAGLEQSTMIESLRGIVTLRLYNKETSRHQVWQTRLSDAMNAEASVGRIVNWQQAGSTGILGLETIISIWLAIRMVIEGGFSVGMVFAFMAYKTQFLQRSASLLDQIVNFRMLGLHLERLSDIALADQDPSFSGEVEESRILAGRIELRNVGYRYSPADPWVIRGLDLCVEPGSHVAITGASGGGKSTLVRIILGLVEPEEGEVLIDGVPLKKFGIKQYHDQVGAVLQDDHLFAGTLAENIALYDDYPDQSLINECIDTAALSEDIRSMPMGSETLVGDMGSSLSGGQQQRLLLARALYRRPRLIVLDEGTSHLDSYRENIVNSAIKKLGITRIIIAHRLETITAADVIYVVEKGIVREQTTLFKQKDSL